MGCLESYLKDLGSKVSMFYIHIYYSYCHGKSALGIFLPKAFGPIIPCFYWMYLLPVGFF